MLAIHWVYIMKVFDHNEEIFILEVPDVSDFLPRTWPFSPQWPMSIERFLSYLMSISAALGLLNLAPIFYLDGAYAFQTLVDIFASSLSRHMRNQISKSIFSFTLILMVTNMGLSLLAM
jgi:membrane-associated protease RseP (regulator of RpoE activity)